MGKVLRLGIVKRKQEREEITYRTPPQLIEGKAQRGMMGDGHWLGMRCCIESHLLEVAANEAERSAAKFLHAESMLQLWQLPPCSI